MNPISRWPAPVPAHFFNWLWIPTAFVRRTSHFGRNTAYKWLQKASWPCRRRQHFENQLICFFKSKNEMENSEVFAFFAETTHRKMMKMNQLSLAIALTPNFSNSKNGDSDLPEPQQESNFMSSQFIRMAASSYCWPSGIFIWICDYFKRTAAQNASFTKESKVQWRTA